ncbi:hypothetical protein EJ06DRAFT_534051 [Trichodelitschia bisporula]|uniref:Uncharacterized protein n=1 Tax=Trichodelitschia bisporula TaxID=703511 RepID=A0A6G1HK98_9PEZI|nr:hypothetical protein EJ06DRAFT_534051 [Trichodelitschia bisporula]
MSASAPPNPDQATASSPRLNTRRRPLALVSRLPLTGSDVRRPARNLTNSGQA